MLLSSFFCQLFVYCSSQSVTACVPVGSFIYLFFMPPLCILLFSMVHTGLRYNSSISKFNTNNFQHWNLKVRSDYLHRTPLVSRTFPIPRLFLYAQLFCCIHNTGRSPSTFRWFVHFILLINWKLEGKSRWNLFSISSEKIKLTWTMRK